MSTAGTQTKSGGESTERKSSVGHNMATSPMPTASYMAWESPHQRLAATISEQDNKIEAQDATIEALASELKQAKERISRLAGTASNTVATTSSPVTSLEMMRKSPIHLEEDKTQGWDFPPQSQQFLDRPEPGETSPSPPPLY